MTVWAAWSWTNYVAVLSVGLTMPAAIEARHVRARNWEPVARAIWRISAGATVACTLLDYLTAYWVPRTGFSGAAGYVTAAIIGWLWWLWLRRRGKLKSLLRAGRARERAIRQALVRTMRERAPRLVP